LSARRGRRAGSARPSGLRCAGCRFARAP
jgi:hypothetical protein